MHSFVREVFLARDRYKSRRPSLCFYSLRSRLSTCGYCSPPSRKTKVPLFKTEVLYNILIEFRKLMTEVKQIKMCFNENYNKFRIDSHLFDAGMLEWRKQTKTVFMKNVTICLFYVGTCGTPWVGTDRVPSQNRQTLRLQTYTLERTPNQTIPQFRVHRYTNDFNSFTYPSN
jgi:hypothetical protein